MKLQDRLRLMVLTHPAPACGRPLIDVVAECVRAGASAIQLRDKEVDGRQLAEAAAALLSVTREAGVLLIVNDRLDVALAAGADGVHLGPRDIPLAAARAISPPGFLLGYSTDDPDTGRTAAEDGADYLGVGAVYPTRSKPGLENEAIGPRQVGLVLRAAGLPGVGIGGITARNAAAVLETGAGLAVISEVMAASDPAERVRALLTVTVAPGEPPHR
ncbi:MAG: thiamine phosphate synthase [Gemmatimonadota bacterium]